jgi:beta-amylase
LFQYYDRYLQKNLRKAAEARGHTIWARGPDNAGHYNSEPNLTGFFCDGGDYDSYYGRFFLNWYSQTLVDHADRVLMLARLVFEGYNIAVKVSNQVSEYFAHALILYLEVSILNSSMIVVHASILVRLGFLICSQSKQNVLIALPTSVILQVSGVHWWYKTASHAAELTAGFYNPCNRDGYSPIAAVLKKYDAALNFTCVELRTMDQHEVYPEAFADPEGLVWQVGNCSVIFCFAFACQDPSRMMYFPLY